MPEVVPFEAVDELIAALGAAPEHGYLPIEGYRNGPVHVYVEFPSEDAVAASAAGHRRARAARRVRDQLLRGIGLAVEDADVRTGAGRGRGSGHGLGGRAPRGAPGPVRSRAVRDRDRDRAGRRDTAPVGAARAGRGQRVRGRRACVRWRGGASSWRGASTGSTRGRAGARHPSDVARQARSARQGCRARAVAATAIPQGVRARRRGRDPPAGQGGPAARPHGRRRRRPLSIPGCGGILGRPVHLSWR